MSSAWDGLVNSKACTELPHYAISKKLPEDTYYTDRKVATHCINVFWEVCNKYGLDFKNHTFIEPSAGEGCFYDLLPDHKVGLDILPRNTLIKKADFLSWYPAGKDQYVVIGNPPFGVRGAIALAFIKRAFLFADAVAFILPMSFYSNGKGSNMKRIGNAGLIHNEKIQEYAFYLPNSQKRISVNSVFQIWIKGMETQVFTDYDVSGYADIYTCCSAPARYCGLGRGRDYDCFIASTFYKEVGIVRTFKEVLYGSGYGLVIKQGKNKILQYLSSIDWRDYCSDATNHCLHIRMHHIRKVLGEGGFGVKI